MERLESEKKYTKEEIAEKFPEIATKTNELKAILDWFNSPEARKIAPGDYTRKELHYRKVEGTDLKTPHDFTGSMHIGEAVRKRFINLSALRDVIPGYEAIKDSERAEAIDKAWKFLLGESVGEDRNELMDELNKEVEGEVERMKQEKE